MPDSTPESKTPVYPIINHLLSALPNKEYERLRPHLELISLSLGEVLYEAGTAIRYVYFPNDSMISLLSLQSEGEAIEVGVVGREGMVGLPVFLGTNFSPNLVIVQVADGAMRMKAAALKRELGRGGALTRLLLRYTQARLIQISQTAACNSLHKVRERFCRWLLLVHDCVGADDFPLTHELISGMLGVRRASITAAAHSLQEAGLIRYCHGHMTILDRQGLERTACDCYRLAAADVSRYCGN